MYRFFAAALILTFAITLPAQTRHTRHHKAKADSVPGMASAKQSEEMKKMTDTFAGMWITTTTVEKSMFFPTAGTSKGRSDFRSGPAGNSLIERARSHGIMGLFAGMGVIWWDAKSSSYQGLWCDSLSPDGCDPMGKGQWDGNNLVFNSSMDMGQQGKMQIRETYSDITTDSFTFTMESGMDGAPMTKMMTIQYQREQPKTTMAPPATQTPATNPATPQTD